MDNNRTLTAAGIDESESTSASEAVVSTDSEGVPPQQTGVGPFLLVYLVVIGFIIRYFVRRYRRRHPNAEQKRESVSPEILQAMKDGSLRPKSRVGFVLFAIFLGALGIHNFYALRIKSAVAQLLLTLFTGVALGAATGLAYATKWAWWLENGWLVAAVVEPLVVLGVWIWSIVEICVVDRDGRGVPMQ